MRAWTGWAGLNCCSFTFQTMQRTLEFGILPLQHSGLKLLAVDGASGWLGICDLLVWQDLSVFSFLLKCEHHNEQHQYCYSSILALSYCRHWKKQSAVFCCCITNSDLFHNYCTCHPLRCQENDLATRMCQRRTGQWSQHVWCVERTQELHEWSECANKPQHYWCAVHSQSLHVALVQSLLSSWVHLSAVSFNSSCLCAMVSSESGVLVSSYLSSDVGADLSWQLLSSYRDMLGDDNKFDVMISPNVRVCVWANDMSRIQSNVYSTWNQRHPTQDQEVAAYHLLAHSISWALYWVWRPSLMKVASQNLWAIDALVFTSFWLSSFGSGVMAATRSQWTRWQNLMRTQLWGDLTVSEASSSICAFCHPDLLLKSCH